MRALFYPFKKCYLLSEILLVSLFNLLPQRVRARINSRIEIVGRLDYPSHKIFLSVTSELEQITRLNSCKKEPETVDWIESYFQPGDVFFDVGANVGPYSLIAAKFLQENIKVYAFEPGFANYAQLCRNIHLNNCADIIIPLQVALSKQTSLETFNYSNLISGGALHSLGAPVDYKGDVFEPVAKMSVLAYKIDDFIPQFQVSIPNHLKIDVDGIEFEILQGATETLQNLQVKSVILELEEGRGDANAVVDFLAERKFRLLSKHHQQDRVYNYIFLRE